MISSRNYTFYIASTPGQLRKLIIPAYILHGLAALAIIGSITVIAAVGSYSRMLWKVGNYNALRHDQETLKKQYRDLQSTVKDTNERLDSLQSLATDVAMTYGVLRYHPAAFDQTDNEATPQDAFDRSLEQYSFLKRNAGAIAISASGLRLLPAMAFADSNYTPSIWPVMGHITDSFGERLDPFSGEVRSTLALTSVPNTASRFTSLLMASLPRRKLIPAMAVWLSSSTVSASPPSTRTFLRFPSCPAPTFVAVKSSATPASAVAPPVPTSTTKSA